jgi:hypothetical protein
MTTQANEFVSRSEAKRVRALRKVAEPQKPRPMNHEERIALIMKPFPAVMVSDQRVAHYGQESFTMWRTHGRLHRYDHRVPKRAACE